VPAAVVVVAVPGKSPSLRSPNRPGTSASPEAAEAAGVAVEAAEAAVQPRRSYKPRSAGGYEK